MKRILLALILALSSVPAFAQVSVIVTPSGATAFPIVIPASAVNGAGLFSAAVLQFGCATASCAGLRGVGTTVDVITADASAFTQFRALSFNMQAGGSIQLNGTPLFLFTAPTISSGFGTSPAILSSNGPNTFRVNVGTGGVATSGVIGMPAATNGWNCQVTDLTNNTVTRETGSTTTTVTVTAAAAWAASDTLLFNCAAY